MCRINDLEIGIYEKALPKNTTWEEKLTIAKNANYTFIEISVDETDERLARLDWTLEERMEFRDAVLKSGLRVPSMCFSGHRRFPLGSENVETRNKALELMRKAIEFAVDTGIRTIQLAGYDVYYEESNDNTKKLFIEGLKESVRMAEKANVMLAMEIMDHPFMSSITKYLEYAEMINSPFFKVYPDLGNLSAWPENDVEFELEKGINDIVAIHLKDTLAVTKDFPGKFKEVPFGEGCVNFPKLFKKLKELNYTGAFLIEMWTEKSDNPILEVKNAKKWMLERMKEGGYLGC